MTTENPKPEEIFALPADFDMEAFESRLDPDSKALVDEMRADALSLPLERREAIEHDVQEFLGEMALSEWMQSRAEEHIRRAKELAQGSGKEVLKESKTVTLDGSKIGWIPGDSNITVALEEQGPEDHSYLFGTIVNDHRVTKTAYQHLEQEGIADHLMELLNENSIPRLLEDLKSGTGKLRPISMGGRTAKDVKPERSLNTQYPAYKVDVQGTSNRAIVLLADKQEETPVVILAAMYDHEDQGKVLSTLFLKGSHK